MKQYIELLKTIQEKGAYKPAARENMPGTQSLFGYQFRHDLADGFPLLTTKKISFKNIVTELLWFLRGDTNIKYLVDNDCNIWNEDAYNYYLKQCKNHSWTQPMSFDTFVEQIKADDRSMYDLNGNKTVYRLGDCGFQYGRVWREWGERDVPSGILKINDQHFTEAQKAEMIQQWEKACRNSSPIIYKAAPEKFEVQTITRQIDQIKTLIEGLKNNPESRRHIVTAIDPSHDQDLALYWCHAMFQFNCRPLTFKERSLIAYPNGAASDTPMSEQEWINLMDFDNIPKYYLDCQLYQRSADSVLGVPYNIASYALLTHIIAKICNMIPGEFIHSFGDVHIYDNHREAVAEQLTREPKELPIFESDWIRNFSDIDEFVNNIVPEQIVNCLRRYDPSPSIKAELSTGLIK